MENFGKLKRRCPAVIWSAETVQRTLGYVKTAFLYSVTVTYRFRLHGPIESRGLVICDAWCNCTATMCPRANTPGYTKSYFTAQCSHHHRPFTKHTHYTHRQRTHRNASVYVPTLNTALQFNYILCNMVDNKKIFMLILTSAYALFSRR